MEFSKIIFLICLTLRSASTAKKVTLYGLDSSLPVRTASLCLKAVNVEYEFIQSLKIESNFESDLSGGYGAVTNSTTVVKIESEKYIYGSQAICAYFAKNSTFYPNDHGIIDYRLRFESKVLLKTIETIESSYGNKLTQWKNETIYEAYYSCEKFLKYCDYIGGNSLSIADFCYLPAISFLNNYVPVFHDQYLRLFSWLERMRGLPYYDDAFSGVQNH